VSASQSALMKALKMLLGAFTYSGSDARIEHVGYVRMVTPACNSRVRSCGRVEGATDPIAPEGTV